MFHEALIEMTSVRSMSGRSKHRRRCVGKPSACPGECRDPARGPDWVPACAGTQAAFPACGARSPAALDWQRQVFMIGARASGDYSPLLQGPGGGEILAMTNFALIGAAGYIAPRHMQAIQATGNRLV